MDFLKLYYVVKFLSCSPRWLFFIEGVGREGPYEFVFIFYGNRSELCFDFIVAAVGLGHIPILLVINFSETGK